MLGIGGAGVVIGASGVGSIFSFKSMFDTPEDEEMHMSFMAKFKLVLLHPHNVQLTL